MPLPSSGNTITLGQVNTELGRSATANINMNDTAVRALFGKPGSGNTISMSDGWGKANFTVAYTGGFVNGIVNQQFVPQFGTGSSGFRWLSNGAMEGFSGQAGYYSLGENWGSPTTTGIGANYWIRFTRTSTAGPQSSTASTGWLQLNSPREINISSSNQISSNAIYTIEISSSSSGSPVLTTRTGVSLALAYEGGGTLN
jgi:hypothetical protein